MLGHSPIVEPLTDAQLPASVFAERPWEGVSSKYAFVSTGAVVHALADVGLRPYLAKSSRTRIESKWGYTKHLLRFRQEGAVALPGGVYPEVVIVNSHDRGSSFRADLGLYRLICKNGLVASYGTMAAYRGIHVALDIESILEGVATIIGQFPRVAETVLLMQRHTLDSNQRAAFAHAASLLRWDADKAPFDSANLLRTRRDEDVEPTLWNVFNTVQENLLQGQSMRFRGRFYGQERPRTSREVKSIDMDMSINGGLWSLASQYAGTA